MSRMIESEFELSPAAEYGCVSTLVGFYSCPMSKVWFWGVQVVGSFWFPFSAVERGFLFSDTPI